MAEAQVPLTAKVKVAGKVGSMTFEDEKACVIEIDGREFTFTSEERVYDVFKYIENELS
jgi:hypothetical protein